MFGMFLKQHLRGRHETGEDDSRERALEANLWVENALNRFAVLRGWDTPGSGDTLISQVILIKVAIESQSCLKTSRRSAFGVFSFPLPKCDQVGCEKPLVETRENSLVARKRNDLAATPSKLR